MRTLLKMIILTTIAAISFFIVINLDERVGNAIQTLVGGLFFIALSDCYDKSHWTKKYFAAGAGVAFFAAISPWITAQGDTGLILATLSVSFLLLLASLIVYFIARGDKEETLLDKIAIEWTHNKIIN